MRAEGVVVEQVLILVEFGDVVVAEAVRVKSNGGVVIEAPLVTSQIPVYEGEREFSLVHIDQVWNVLEVLFHIVLISGPLQFISLRTL